MTGVRPDRAGRRPARADSRTPQPGRTTAARRHRAVRAHGRARLPRDGPPRPRRAAAPVDRGPPAARPGPHRRRRFGMTSLAKRTANIATRSTTEPRTASRPDRVLGGAVEGPSSASRRSKDEARMLSGRAACPARALDDLDASRRGGGGEGGGGVGRDCCSRPVCSGLGARRVHGRCGRRERRRRWGEGEGDGMVLVPCDSRAQGERCARSRARAVATTSCPVSICTPKGSPEPGGSWPPSLPAFSATDRGPSPRAKGAIQGSDRVTRATASS